MGTDDKTQNQGDRIKGKLKETIGRVTGDEEKEREGRTEQTKADVKDAGENVKDAFRR